MFDVCFEIEMLLVISQSDFNFFVDGVLLFSILVLSMSILMLMSMILLSGFMGINDNNDDKNNLDDSGFLIGVIVGIVVGGVVVIVVIVVFFFICWCCCFGEELYFMFLIDNNGNGGGNFYYGVIMFFFIEFFFGFISNFDIDLKNGCWLVVLVFLLSGYGGYLFVMIYNIVSLQLLSVMVNSWGSVLLGWNGVQYVGVYVMLLLQGVVVELFLQIVLVFEMDGGQ